MKSFEVEKKIIIVICITFSVGCALQSKVDWEGENKKVEECRNNWRYEDLKTSDIVTVLQFYSKSKSTLRYSPNFLIGIDGRKDTVAFVDKEYEGLVEIGQRINASPSHWSDDEKRLLRPSFIVSNKVAENNLL